MTIVAGVVFSNAYMFGLGQKNGYFSALTDMKDKADLEFTWTENPDGTFTVNMWKDTGSLSMSKTVNVDCYVELERAGIIISAGRHAGTLTNIGKDHIEQQISGTINATAICKYISTDDTDSSGLTAASTQLTSENTVSGLGRATGTYTSTGAGAWTVVKAFSVTGTIAAQTYGLQWTLTPLDGNLLCYDTSAVKNCVNGDTLTVTWTISVT